MPHKLLAMKFPFYFCLSKEAAVMRFIHSYLQTVIEKRGSPCFPLFCSSLRPYLSKCDLKSLSGISMQAEKLKVTSKSFKT